MTQTYDYVVVGAGSAGCVLAARLTEDPSITVLLLEAGGEADADQIAIPAAFANLFKTKWDWNYDTVDQKHLGGRSAYWPRMRALGGCSSMNAMIYIRGNHADYDGWRDENGCAGWGFDDVLPYFMRSEGNTRLGAPFHGQDGPLHVEDRRYTHPMSHAWVEAAVADGLTRLDDFNGAQQEGAGLYQVTCRKGRRWSTERAYLDPARKRPKLTVHTDALAARIDLDGDRAVGVTYRQGGQLTSFRAGVEVPVSSGGDRVAETAHAVGHRPGSPPARGRRRGAARPGRSGTEHARPPGRRDHLEHPRNDRPRQDLEAMVAGMPASSRSAGTHRSPTTSNHRSCRRRQTRATSNSSSTPATSPRRSTTRSAPALARTRMKPVMNLTSFGRTAAMDKNVGTLITALHGRPTQLPKLPKRRGR